MTVEAPLQSVTKVISPSSLLSSSSEFALLSQPELTFKTRVVHSAGHNKPPEVAVHDEEVVQPSWHCILTVKGVPSLGTCLNAISPMLRVLESYSTVIVFIFVSLNACFTISVQLDVRIPQSPLKW